MHIRWDIIQCKCKNIKFLSEFMHLRFKEKIETQFCIGQRTATTIFFLRNRTFGLTLLIYHSYRVSKYPKWKILSFIQKHVMSTKEWPLKFVENYSHQKRPKKLDPNVTQIRNLNKGWMHRCSVRWVQETNREEADQPQPYLLGIQLILPASSFPSSYLSCH